MISPERLGWNSPDAAPSDAASGPADDLYGVGDLAASVMRSWPVLAAVFLVGVTLAYAGLKRIQPLYAASAQISLDIRQMLSLNDRLDPTTGIPKISLVMTHVAMMRSNANLLAVVDKLKLETAPEFRDLGPPELRDLNDTALAAGRDQRRLAIVEAIQSHLLVERVAQTYIVTIQYMDPDPAFAAAVANAIADQYLVDQLNARYDATLRAGDWIQQHLDDLKRRASDAAFAVEDYRVQSGLVEAGGRSLNDDQLRSLGDLVVEAIREMAQATTRLNRIATIRTSNDLQGSVSDALGDTTIVALRKKYGSAASRLSELQHVVGNDQAGALAPLRDQVVALRQQITDELARLATRYEADDRAAMAKLQDLQKSLSEARQVALKEGGRSIRLRELERSAQIMSDAYGNFLRGYLELTQKNAFPTSEARILSRAAEPGSVSFPPRPLMLLNCILASLVAATAFALRRGLSNASLKTAADVTAELGFDCLAVIARRRGHAPAQTGTMLADDPGFASATDALSAIVGGRRLEPGGSVLGVMQAFADGIGGPVASALATNVAGRGRSVLVVTLSTAQAEGAFSSEVATADEAQSLFSTQSTTLPMLRASLREARQRFEVVVLDLPPMSHRLECLAAGVMADAILIGIEAGARHAAMIRSVTHDDINVLRKVAGVLLYGARPSLWDRVSRAWTRVTGRSSRRLSAGYAATAGQP